MRTLSKDIHFPKQKKKKKKKHALKESLWGTFPVIARITSVSYNLGPFMTLELLQHLFSSLELLLYLIGDTSWTIARHAMLN